MTRPVYIRNSKPSSGKKTPFPMTNRATLSTSLSTLHLSFKLSLYSMAARSRAVTTPSLSEALAFHMRTFPSSEPERTNLASAENIEDVTLVMK